VSEAFNCTKMPATRRLCLPPMSDQRTSGTSTTTSLIAEGVTFASAACKSSADTTEKAGSDVEPEAAVPVEPVLMEPVPVEPVPMEPPHDAVPVSAVLAVLAVLAALAVPATSLRNAAMPACCTTGREKNRHV
jgi:hypothetical protein